MDRKVSSDKVVSIFQNRLPSFEPRAADEDVDYRSVHDLSEELALKYPGGAERGTRAAILARSLAQAIGLPAPVIDDLWAACKLHELGSIPFASDDDSAIYEDMPFAVRLEHGVYGLREAQQYALTLYLAAARYSDPGQIATFPPQWQIAHCAINFVHDGIASALPINARLELVGRSGYDADVTAAMERELSKDDFAVAR